MNKKILSVFLALCTTLSMASGAVMAAEHSEATATALAASKVDESTEIKNAMAAIKAGKDTAPVHNDMTADGFLKVMTALLPEGSSVTLSFDKESDYRIWNTSSTKAGSIFANILFTCGVYTQHEMYDITIPMLTGDEAEANADNEKLDEDAAAVSSRMKFLSVNNDSTKEEMLEMAREVIKNGSTVEWEDDFEKVDSTSTAMGSIKGTLKLTLNSVSKTVEVSKLIRLDIPENQNIPRSTPQPKTTQAPESTTTPEPTAQPENTPAPTAEATPGFTDVSDDAYYAEAVNWAVENKITAGTSATTFSPDDTCTRAQILTFLWRAVGSPEATAANPFSDVDENAYYYDAAIWASEKGMVTGSTFEGDTPCTRSSTVTYLWKNAGAPEQPDLEMWFDDVAEDAEYAQAVAWALDYDVTSGTSETTFSPDNTCTRGQIVTFLNRAIQ